ncbi:MAG: IPT/TIG domain-containing protein, partial [Methanoregula sp.]
MKVVDLHLGRTGKTNRPFRFSILLCIAVVFLLAMVGAASAAIPTVTSVTPAAGPLAGGTSVTILGTGFISGGTTVYFGNTAVTATVTVTGGGTHIVTDTPVASIAGPVDVTVVTVGGTSTTSAADVYTYRNVPAITSLSPNYGNTAGGNTVTITGTGFSQATAVMFGS